MKFLTKGWLVFFAAVISGVREKRCVTTLITAVEETKGVLVNPNPTERSQPPAEVANSA